MMTYRGRRIALVDLEASALLGGFPIEIGVCLDPAMGFESTLVRPDPEWNSLFWDPQSEALTGIGRAELLTAPTAAEVCDLFEEWIGDAAVVVEHLAHDGPWLDQLYEAAGRKRLFAPLDFTDVVMDLVREHDRPLENVYGAFDLVRGSGDKPHRAGPDALLLGKVLKLALDPNFSWTYDDPQCPIDD